MCLGRYGILLSSHKKYECISDGDTCTAEKPVVDCYESGLGYQWDDRNTK